VFGRGHVRSLVSAIKTYPDFRTDPRLRVDAETKHLLFGRGYITREELGVLAGTRGLTRGPSGGPNRLPTWESICGSTPDSAQDSADDSCDMSEGTDEETADDDDSNEDSRDSRDSDDSSEDGSEDGSEDSSDDGSDYASSDDNLSCGTSDEAVGPDGEQTPAGRDLSEEIRILKECFSANPVAVSA
jgi:hypothetical protein